MIRSVFLALSIACFALLPTMATAQRGGGQLLKPGTILPSLVVVDQQGEKFSTDTLRGHHTVLVFGCLT